MPVTKKFSQKVNKFVSNMSNSVFSMYATVLTLGFALIFSFVWILEASFFFYIMPLTSFCFEENVAVNTFVNNGTNGPGVYAIKTSQWLEEYAPCSLNSVISYDNSTWGGEPLSMHIGPTTLMVRDRAAECSSYVRENSPAGASILDPNYLFDRFESAVLAEDAQADVQTLWENTPVKCECSINGHNRLNTYMTWKETFYMGFQHTNVNGWNEIVNLQKPLKNNVFAKDSVTDHTVGCCRCAYTDSNLTALPDFCGDKGTDDEEFLHMGGNKLNTYLGWDLIHTIVMVGVSSIFIPVIGHLYSYQNFMDVFGYNVLSSIPSFTIGGATMMHYVFGFGLVPKASVQLLNALGTIVLCGWLLSKRVVDNTKTEVQKISTKAYVWVLFGATGLSIFIGPFLVTVVVSKIYVSPDTTDVMRTIIAVFAVPLVFWLICTCGRFNAYETCKFGSKGHAVSHKHKAFAMYFGTQFVFSIYNRMFVAGQSGTTDEVGNSISERSGLILTALLSMGFGIIARVSTQYRDRGMYWMWHLGKKSLPKDYFNDPDISQFLECDMLIYESFIDSASLCVVIFLIYIMEVRAGVNPNDAASSAFLNWFIQMVIEQIGNFFIFYLRQKKKGTFRTPRPSMVAPASDENEGTEKFSDDLDVSKSGSFNVVNMKVWKVIRVSWWILIVAPFITILLIRVVGPNTMRGMYNYYESSQ